jgi:hypothetical protein
MNESSVVNIGLFCNEDRRSDELNHHLKDTEWKTVNFKFKDIPNKYIKFEDYDLFLFDLTTAVTPDVKNIISLRSRKNLLEAPFLYILKEEQLTDFDTLCKDKPSNILIDPFQPLEIESLVRNLSAMSQLQQRVEANKTLISNDNKLIYQYESILQLAALDEAGTEEEFFASLQNNTQQKIELTFAAERALFLAYDRDKNNLVFNDYASNKKNAPKAIELAVQSSQIAGALKENSPMILKEQMLLDPFIQALEDVISAEISSLLFVPLVVLRQTHGALVIINKRNRRSFSENDLAISMIVIGKIIYRMEKLYLLEKTSAGPLDADLKPAGTDRLTVENNFCRDILDAIGNGLIIFDQTYTLH